jgi:hypothetical protein
MKRCRSVACLPEAEDGQCDEKGSSKKNEESAHGLLQTGALGARTAALPETAGGERRFLLGEGSSPPKGCGLTSCV